MRITEDMRTAYEKGYNAGYKDGLKDGNPFITIAENVSKALESVTERLNDPEFLEFLIKYKEGDKTDSGLLEEE